MPSTNADPGSAAGKDGRSPRHVAIIMDGNGRWAKRRFLPRVEGHRAGARSVRRALETAMALDVRSLTLYTFSLENWERPAKEVAELMKMLRQYLVKERRTMLKQGIRLRAVGRRELLPPEVLETLEAIERETAPGASLDLSLALSYGGRQEIAQAAADVAALCRQGSMAAREITPALIGRRLLTADLPPVDLLIRTSGEHRISNFLLWQSPGAYLHFTPTLWPDFGKQAFQEAVTAWRTGTGGRAGRAGA